MNRIGTSTGAALALSVFLAIALGLSSPASAAGSVQDDPSSPEPTRKERRQQAKQERIDRYLAKREEKQARKAAEQERQAAERAAKAAEQEAAASERAAAAATAAPPASENAPADAGAATDASRDTGKKSAWGRRHARSGSTDAAAASASPVRMSRELAGTQERLLRGPIGSDPEGRAHLDAIQAGHGTPTVLGELGNLLARRGYSADAVVYYRSALSADPTNESLWLNLGSVHLTRGELSSAERAFGKVLAMDPNQAFAHYNLGAVHQAAGRYEEAVESFRRALILDPDLGDPEKNPQAATNELMVPVKLLLYKQQAGSLALPLRDIDESRPESN